MTDDSWPWKIPHMKFIFLYLILGVVPHAVFGQDQEDQQLEMVKSCEDLQETDANFKKRIVECMGPKDWKEAKLESPVVNH